MAVLKIGKVVLKSLFKKPATLMYPIVPREWQERTRGHIEINVEDCILCGICSKKCPSNAITVDKGKRTWMIERMKCIQCGSCYENCPKKCLVMRPEYTAPDVSKTVDTFDIPAAEKKTAGSTAGGGAPGCNAETCIYCGICAKQCPCNAITVDRKEKTWKVDAEICIGCGVCVEKCPKGSLVIK